MASSNDNINTGADTDWDLQNKLHDKIDYNKDILITALTAKKWSLLYEFVRNAQHINCMTSKKAAELVRKGRNLYGANTKEYTIAAGEIVSWSKSYILNQSDKTKVLSLFNILTRLMIEGLAHMTMRIASLSKPLIKPDD